MKLGTRLLRDGVIGLSELEAALRAQVLYGGRLGTNLIELGFLDVDTVGHFLALALEAPEATRERFEQTPASALERFGGELARAHSAFPLGPEPGSDRFAIAVLDPTEVTKSALLSEALDQPVVLYAAAEMRLFFFLEKHFGIEREVRYIRTGGPPREQGQIERRRIQGAPRVVRVEPRRTRSGNIETVDAEIEPVVATPALTVRDLDEITAAMEAARHRDQIGSALVSYAPGRIDAIAVLLIRDQIAMGWCAFSRHGSDAEAVGQLSLPLGELSTLKLCYDANEVYWGPPPTKDAPLERELGATLGIPDRPERTLVVPVAVRDRVVNLIYALSSQFDAETRAQLAMLANRAGDAYMRLIRGFKVNG